MDTCDAAGMCTHPIAPSLTCTPHDVTAGASLLLRTLALGGNQAQFKWGKGPVVPATDFGDPTGGELLQLCVYDQTAPTSYALVLSGSPSVAGGGAWTGSLTGWRFKSATGAPDGIVRVMLKARTIPLRAKVQMKVVRSPSFEPLPLQSAPSVIAQFKTSLGACWGASFSTPMMNTATEFKARSD